MKKGLIAIVVAAVVAVGGAGGYMMYQKKAEEKAYNEEVKKAINSLPSIVVYEKEDLPTVESEFANAGSCIDINSVEPDISNVYTTEPGEYEVKYTFKDSKGEQRTATVPCIVKPELSMHVTGMKDIEIDKGDDLPTESGCEYDDQYVSSVTLNTENVDNEEAGTYDISYTILGVDNDMKTVDGYTCTVNEVATPTPTPTPKPTATPTPKPKKDKEDKKDKKKTEAEITPTVKPSDGTEVGNVEVQNNVVETGDENNIFAIGALIVVCLAAAGGVIVYKKKKDNK